MNVKNKKLSEWEKERGILFLSVSEKDLNKDLSFDEFTAMLRDPETPNTSVDFESRQEFLEANGYDVTRANLADATLSARASEDQS